MSFVAAVSALGLGFVHGLGLDHLMAIAALAVNGEGPQSRGRVLQTALGFAVGHTLVLACGAALAIGFGLVLPAAAEAGAERAGGLLLVGLGVVGLWGLASGRAYSHVHPERDGAPRWHMHLGRGSHPHGHSSIPTVLGAVFAVSSLRALMLLQPFGASAAVLSLPAVLVLIMLFGLGVLLSMSLFGVVLARALSTAAVQVIGQGAAGLVAVASILLGGYWMFWR
jgi:hypothetical protein